ncbi:serine O-acetyltransferase EpsC [Chitinasiproducens palmae]|uniref:serine O-acetyltransferase n=1 Tax=Chitinasiproducens palmae TaxID=1770053 RepID=A0A1H2PJQ7_9BURK|nr:serine O-acetyltransferase EpsC [Chitinasiproducens palmae]SDV46104.1 serine O-acetyltransferase [Chitinasiproducens palmae]
MNEAPASERQAWPLDEIVAALRHSREVTHHIRHRGAVRELPSRRVIAEVVEGLTAALFPTHHGREDLNDANIDYYVGNTLARVLPLLTEQVRRSLLCTLDGTDEADPHYHERARAIAAEFAAQLVPIRALLVSDLRAAYQGDPAANSISEVLLVYPGVTAVAYHRIAHRLYKLGATLVARLISEIAHSTTGIEIHPGAHIGESFFIDHGTGVVIGETAIIGNRVRLYQAVTLGAKRFPVDETGALVKGNARHPIVEDDVVIYAGATILGRITLGAGSTIGGNVWLTHSVPPNSSITQAQMRSDCE